MVSTNSHSRTTITNLVRIHDQALTLVALTLLGFYLRIRNISDKGYSMDEALMIYESLTGILIEQTPFLPPVLRRLLLHISGKVTPFNMHILSVVWGTLSIPAAYFLGKELHRKTTGLMTAGLVTLSPVMIFFSQEGRSYAALILASTLVALFYFRAYRAGGWNWFFYFLCLLWCASSHLLTSHVVMALSCTSIFYYLWRLNQTSSRARDKNDLLIFFTLTITASVIGFSYAYTRPGVTSVIDTTYSFGPLNYIANILMNLSVASYTYIDDPFSYNVIVSLFYALFFFLGLIHFFKNRKIHEWFYFSTLLLIPVIILYFSLGVKSSWPWGRYICFLVIPFHATIAFALSQHNRMVPEKICYLLLLIGFIPTLMPLLSQKETFHTAYYRPYFETIKKESDTLDGIIIISSQGVYRVPMLYYLYKNNDLPVYLWNEKNNNLTKIVPRNSLVPSIEVPATSEPGFTHFSTGKYAILDWPEVEPKSCENLQGLIGSGTIVTLRDDDKLRACRIVPQKNP